MMIRRILMSSCLALLLAPTAAWCQTEVGRARFTPWSGYWWKIREGRIMAPLRKYDNLTGKLAMTWESRNKDRFSAAPWEGYCHAWSAAAIIEREPRKPRTVRGANGRSMVLSVGDQKAWLTICHTGDDANFHGTRYSGKPGEDMQDIYPDVLWRYLRLYVKQRRVPLVLDIDAKEPVWNYPVYSYRVTYRDFGSSGQKLGRMEIWMADDKVQPDHIGVKVKKKTYQFTFRMEGNSPKLGTGRWYGASKNDHPDFAWYPTVTKPKNPHISHTSIRQMLGANTRLTTSRGPEELDGEVADVETSRRIAVSSTELATLLAGHGTRFGMDLSVTSGKAAGEYAVRGKSQKDGHLYLFGVAADGSVRLLYPTNGQDNRVQGGKLFEKAGFVAPKGAYRIKGLVSVKPLSLDGLQDEEESVKPGMGLAFDWSPSEEEVVQDLLVRSAAKKLSAAELEESTGVRAVDLLGEFGRAEATLRGK